MLIHGEGEQSTHSLETIAKRYDAGETDEFLKPILTENFEPIKEGDAVFCINFRTDRCREITQVLTQESFAEWNMHPLQLHYTTMTEYSKDFKNVAVIFRNDKILNSLGEVISLAGKSQTRMAETEKYPHVTFFFSGGREAEFPQEKVTEYTPGVLYVTTGFCSDEVDGFPPGKVQL
jgi:2,3-bisphosphoglycerate-independent phosphoglycerate mutase